MRVGNWYRSREGKTDTAVRLASVVGDFGGLRLHLIRESRLRKHGEERPDPMAVDSLVLRQVSLEEAKAIVAAAVKEWGAKVLPEEGR